MESINNNFSSLSQFPTVPYSFDGPTYFIGGGDSNFLKQEHHAIIKQTIFPSAKFDYIAGAGHWLHAEKPDLFLKLVTQFLTTL